MPAHYWKHLWETTVLGFMLFSLRAQNYLLVQKHSSLITEKKVFLYRHSSAFEDQIGELLEHTIRMFDFEIAVWVADLNFIKKEKPN